MNVSERVLICKLLLKIGENKEFSKGIGVTDVSRFKNVEVKTDEGKKERIAYGENNNGFGVL